MMFRHDFRMSIKHVFDPQFRHWVIIGSYFSECKCYENFLNLQKIASKKLIYRVENIISLSNHRVK